ncbi:unnamed protein product, partial [Iphiclides podalirius]
MRSTGLRISPSADCSTHPALSLSVTDCRCRAAFAFYRGPGRGAGGAGRRAAAGAPRASPAAASPGTHVARRSLGRPGPTGDDANPAPAKVLPFRSPLSCV